jgi:serralysin
MIGGAGWDGYLVDNAADQVIENPGEGTDTIYATIGIFLPANVENLTLIGGADTNGYGNALDNTVTGNYASNWLNGEDGADTMIGGAGNDMLIGGAGNDTFLFQPGFGHDTIGDFAAGPGSDDVIDFTGGLFGSFANVMSHAAQAGSDVVITYDALNAITLKNVALASLSANDFAFA